MKIAVINETSAGDKNRDIITSLQGFDHSILNIGMKASGVNPELTYIQTGFLAGIFLNTNRADLVVGGCGTGQGFQLAAMQYPGVYCGLIQSPLDAWLFAQINGGNCISLALNKGYGWGENENLKFIFEKLFSVEFGQGYPEHRRLSQQKSRAKLLSVSMKTHLQMSDIVRNLDNDIVVGALGYPGVWEALDIANLGESEIKSALLERFMQMNQTQD